jgi:Bacterial SH3 domain/NlpC/P60 family
MRSLFALVLALFVVACGSTAEPGTGSGTSSTDTFGAPLPGEEEPSGDVGEPGDMPLVGVDDSTIAPDAPLALASKTMRTTGDLNLRKSPSTSAAVILVIPSGSIVNVLDPTPQAGFLNVQWNGASGWSSLAYLEPATTTTTPTPGAVDVDGPASPDNAILRAKTAVGFSYYWGGGAWLESGATSSNKGSCSGSCPSCSHAGKYGADCSGLVAKTWQFGTKALSVNSHPYGTIHFVNDVAGKWSTVSRGSLKKGDALVYNTNGAGHIALYEKGDGWGSSTVYECRGCSYGCVYNTRNFTSNYKGIRRAGF